MGWGLGSMLEAMEGEKTNKQKTEKGKLGKQMRNDGQITICHECNSRPAPICTHLVGTCHLPCPGRHNYGGMLPLANDIKDTRES